MVINSATSTPEYCCPCDIFKLCAGNGDFTVDEDRDAVNETLTKMLKAKVEGYAKEDITLSRLMQVFAPVFVPRHAYGSAALASEGGSALDRLKKFMKWRSDEEEKKWEAETGLNLWLTSPAPWTMVRPSMSCSHKMRRRLSACSRRREKI